MNRTTCTLLNIVLLCANCCAKVPDLLEDGKRWNYYNLAGMPEYCYYYSNYVDGDTVVRNLHCKKLYRERQGEAPTLLGIYYEDGSRVYRWHHSGERFTLEYDFGLEEGETFRDAILEQQLTVTTADTAAWRGRPFRRLILSYPYGDKVEWVDGIGPDMDLTNPLGSLEGSYGVFLSCEKDGVLLFAADGFGSSPMDSPRTTLAGRVTDARGLPIAGAVADYRSERDYPLLHPAVSDSDGYYCLPLGLLSAGIVDGVEVAAPGFAPCTDRRSLQSLDKAAMRHVDYVLYDRAVFRAGQVTGIILPYAPDAAAGEYFRIDRVEPPCTVVFEPEYAPAANTPYAFLPCADLEVSLDGVDCGHTPVTAGSGGAMLVGSYGGLYLSQTMDSCLVALDNYEAGAVPSVAVAPLHACLAVACPSGNARDVKVAIPVCVHPGISDASASFRSLQTYDLQGRRLLGRPAKGLYIRGGRKYAIN